MMPNHRRCKGCKRVKQLNATNFPPRWGPELAHTCADCQSRIDTRLLSDQRGFAAEQAERERRRSTEPATDPATRAALDRLAAQTRAVRPHNSNPDEDRPAS